MWRKERRYTGDRQSDDSLISLSTSLRDLAMNSLRFSKQPFTEEELKDATPKQILQRMLSTSSYISTTSSLATKYNSASTNPSTFAFEELGKGQCGTVYALIGSPTIVKIPNHEGKFEELGIDYRRHTRVQEAIQQHGQNLDHARLPKLHAFLSPKSDFWKKYGLLFPHHVDVRNFGLTSERIFSAPLPVREALVDVLLPPLNKNQKHKFLMKPENKHCIIRMYLGRRCTIKTQKLHTIKLQNFPLHVNEMEDLHLNTGYFARCMANTLAIIHWGAKIDGNDIEFVLGSSPAQTKRPSSDELEKLSLWEMAEACELDFSQRTMEMWVIDFNQCSQVEDDEAGIDKMIKAFIHNDPYYPRPGQADENDQELWKIFRTSYLFESAKLTKSKGPFKFIIGVEETGKSIDSLF
ncbi:hypothetical protein HYE67_000731 [Fusarium culmorum]|uniref:DUF3669 domain-containing protein n=1 Tax=Fusarium culmorum TaxID=5516 RepID=A0A2T4GKV7_FUSCU|nr:hypothetical protein FCULG_00002361 [Fusarium culmorum]QPC58500.1 hypothetical protein HYE67_000731 [Fusarium culmorum]